MTFFFLFVLVLPISYLIEILSLSFFGFKELEEENILNKVSFVTLYYSWRYRGGDLWRLRGASTISDIPITKKLWLFFLSNSTLPKEYFNIKHNFFFSLSLSVTESGACCELNWSRSRQLVCIESWTLLSGGSEDVHFRLI